MATTPSSPTVGAPTSRLRRSLHDAGEDRRSPLLLNSNLSASADSTSFSIHYVANTTFCTQGGEAYAWIVPKLWTDTIEAHRREVRGVVLDTAARLIAENGLHAVTMSRVAEDAGIGRATLYKYFPDIESILHAWHERQIAAHLEQLIDARDKAEDPVQRLHAVLEKYALITSGSRGHHDNELATSLHRDPHVAHAERHLRQLVQQLISDAAQTGAVRDDIPPEELAIYCVHALAAASGLVTKAAVRRLVAVTLSGLQPTST